MRILIATPLYPPDIGGPAKYAYEIERELKRRGISVSVVVWGRLEKILPWGLRHDWYFLRLLPNAVRATHILALDTLTVGLPALCAAKLLRKKFALRVGGDFLWEFYIERTGEMIKLSEFYEKTRALSFKEKIARILTSFVVKKADILFFNTAWQRDIWQKAYGFEIGHARVLENEYSPKAAYTPPANKVFVAAGRGIRYKNIPAFAQAFERVARKHPEIALDTRALSPHENRLRVAASYAVAVPSVSEVNSNFIIEALSFGKPFITAQDSGMRERLEGLGMFVDTLQVEEMEMAIEEMLKPEVYQEYVARIQNFIYTHSWSEIVDEILSEIR